MAKKSSKKPVASYLERVQFSAELLKSWVAGYLQNTRIVVLLVMTIALLGTVSYLSLPKRLNPEVKIPIVTIATVLPGAAPADVESLVTVPIEDAVRQLKGIDQVTSLSRDNISIVTIQFRSTIDRDQAEDDTTRAVAGVNNLPENANEPSVKALDFEDQPVWTFVLSSQGDLPSFMRYAEELRAKIEDVSSVDRVVTNGFLSQEVIVELDPAKSQSLGLNPALLAQQVQRSLSSVPAGTVLGNAYAFSVSVEPSITNVSDIRNMIVSVGGQTMTLGDLATVAEKTKPDQGVTFFASKDVAAERAVVFYVYKTSSSNIDKASTEVTAFVEKELAKSSQGLRLKTITNTGEEITTQFSDLLGEFRTTIILVFGCLLLFLGLRQALISSFTVPLTFLSAFFFMQFFGQSINFLTMFAFLLALGLLVDDTIVVVSAMTTYYKSGRFTPLQTGLLVWKDTIVPIWSTTITTIWSFVPLLITSGIIGEFIKPIPVMVTLTMLSSTAIAVLITLPLMVVILRPNIPGRVGVLLKIVGVLLLFAAVSVMFKGHPFLGLFMLLVLPLLWFVRVTGAVLWQRLRAKLATYSLARRIGTVIQTYTNHGVISIDPLAEAYHRVILRVLSTKSAQRKVLFAIVLYAVVSFALLPLGVVKNEFFPKSDQDVLFVELTQPNGTPIQKTTQLSQQLLDKLRQLPESTFVTAEVGHGAVGSMGGSSSGSNVANFTIHLLPEKERPKSSIEIAEELRKALSTSELGEVRVIEESGGPPVGADVQLSFLGDDLAELEKIADETVAFMKTQPGMTNVEKSIKPGTSSLTFVPDYAALAKSGVSVDQVGLWLRTFASGFQLGKLPKRENQSAQEEVVFRVGRTSGTTQGTAAELQQLLFPTLTGQVYPLQSLGSFVTQKNPTQITRQDGKRTVTVTASVKQGFNTTQENAKLEAHVKALQLPPGYSWQTGGVNEENVKSVQSILQAMLLSAILILVTMVIQFRSFRQAFIVLIVIPLAVSSVFLAFGLTGTPLSFPALIGVLSLFGIVVTNSMFIVDKINLNQAEGMELKDAIADAGASRLEPIVLTKLCTVLGLLPITIADPLWRGLGGAIISGLLVSSTIMLLFIPVLYYSLFGGNAKR